MVLSMKSIASLQDANSIPQLSKNNHLLTVISGFSKRDRGKKWILTLAIFLFNLVLMLSVREPVQKKRIENAVIPMSDLVCCQIAPAWEVKPIAALQGEASQTELDEGSFSS